LVLAVETIVVVVAGTVVTAVDGVLVESDASFRPGLVTLLRFFISL